MAFSLARFLLAVAKTYKAGPTTAATRRGAILRVFQRMGTAKTPLPSGANLIGLLRSKGLGIRTQDFYRMYGSFRRTGAFGIAQRLAPPTKRPLKADVPVWPGFIARRYMYQFTMNVYDYRQEIWKVKPFRMTSERLYSPASAERVFRDWWTEGGFSTDVDLLTAHYDTVWKSELA